MPLITGINSLESFSQFRNVGGKLYFLSQQISTISTRRIMTSDGTPTGTVAVKSFTSLEGVNAVGNLTAVGNLLYYTVDRNNAREIWQHDATGSRMIATVSTVAKQFTAVGDQLYFADRGVGTPEWELYKLADRGALNLTNTPQTASFARFEDAASFTAAGSNIFFMRMTEVGVGTIWKSDGTSQGTHDVVKTGPFGAFRGRSARRRRGWPNQSL